MATFMEGHFGNSVSCILGVIRADMPGLQGRASVDVKDTAHCEALLCDTTRRPYTCGHIVKRCRVIELPTRIRPATL